MLHIKKPRYPADLRYLGNQTVRLRCTVLEDGRVAEIIYQDGPVQLVPLARAAVAQWRYEPLRLYSPFTGRSDAVKFITTIDLRFER